MDEEVEEAVEEAVSVAEAEVRRCLPKRERRHRTRKEASRRKSSRLLANTHRARGARISAASRSSHHTERAV
jgi:hypothetical protein